jgi:hypothetical protein
MQLKMAARGSCPSHSSVCGKCTAALIDAVTKERFLVNNVHRAFEWLQKASAGTGRKPAVHPYDYGLVGEMSVLMNADPQIGPALAELFMQVMFVPGALTRPEREMAATAQDCHY